MTLADFFLYLSLVLYFIAFASQLVAYFVFKKNQSKYESLLSDFRQRGIQLDIITNFASFLGPMFNAHKIAYFVDVYHGKKIYLDRNKSVSEEANLFVKNQPLSRISWIFSLHKLNVASFTVLFLAVALSFISNSLLK